MRTALTTMSIAGLLAAGLAAPAQAAPTQYFSSCAKLVKKYPNGVAKNSAAARKAVRQGFARPAAGKKARKVYQTNKSRLDRDRDGTACEQSA